ncbi:uncharacterized protein LOC122816783 [Protopterus annectens]|uniref:uncharacterized protein LOC122816783 n=1 Tax=Protopterus annectens TaxID=7888 RepID=UPI001CFBF8A5|nr:uncharacterized protein LOC122816783 [Protopterus annectens]XP_043945740.1 uncharacterized protein LOC122816783 [Protopterus annectens]
MFPIYCVHHICSEMSYWLLFFMFSCGLCKAAEVFNLDCTNDYLSDMTCIWEADEGVNCTTEYTLLYERQNKPLLNECIPSNSRIDDNILDTQCECNIKDLYFVAADNFLVTVMSHGEELLNNTIEVPDKIKPKPPYNLTVEKNADENFVLKWEHFYNGSFLEHFLRFEVNYRRKQDPEKNSTVRESSNDKSFIIINSELEAKADYVAKVRVMPKINYNGEWSDWSPYIEWNTDYTISFKDIFPIMMPMICFLLVIPIFMCYCGITYVKKIWSKVPNPFYSEAAKFQLYPVSATYDPGYKKDDVILSYFNFEDYPKHTGSLDEDNCIIFKGDRSFNDSVSGLLFGSQNWFSDPFSKLLVNQQLILPEDRLFNRQSEEQLPDRKTQFQIKEQLFDNSSEFPLYASESKYPRFVCSYTNPPLRSKDWGYPEAAISELPELNHHSFKNSSNNICSWSDVLFHHTAPECVTPDKEKYGERDLESSNYKSFTSCVDDCLPDINGNKSTLRKTVIVDEMSEGMCASLCVSEMHDSQHFNSKLRMHPSGLAADGYQSFNNLISQPFGQEQQAVIVDTMFSSPAVGRSEMPPSSENPTDDLLTGDSNARFTCKSSEMLTNDMCYSIDEEGKLREDMEASLQHREAMNVQLQEMCQSGLTHWSPDKPHICSSNFISPLFAEHTVENWTSLPPFIPQFGLGEYDGTDSPSLLTDDNYQSFGSLANPGEAEQSNEHSILKSDRKDNGLSKCAHVNCFQLPIPNFHLPVDDSVNKSDMEVKSLKESNDVHSNDSGISVKTPDKSLKSDKIAINNILSSVVAKADFMTDAKHECILDSKEVDCHHSNSIASCDLGDRPVDHIKIGVACHGLDTFVSTGYQASECAVNIKDKRSIKENSEDRCKQRFVSPDSMCSFKMNVCPQKSVKAQDQQQIEGKTSDLKYKALLPNQETYLSDHVEDKTHLKTLLAKLRDSTVNSSYSDDRPLHICSETCSQCSTRSVCDDLNIEADETDYCESTCVKEHSEKQHLKGQTVSSQFMMVPIQESSDDEDSIYMKVAVLGSQSDESRHINHKMINSKHKKHFGRHLPIKQWIFN